MKRLSSPRMATFRHSSPRPISSSRERELYWQHWRAGKGIMTWKGFNRINNIYLNFDLSEVRHVTQWMWSSDSLCVTCHVWCVMNARRVDQSEYRAMERQRPRPWLGWHGDMILLWFMLIKIIPTTLPPCHRTLVSQTQTWVHIKNLN